jgi:glycosyltransferase involved in cell wall biosynthesis
MLMSNALPPREGIANYVCNLSKRLVERGHDVIIVTRGGLKSKKTNYAGIRVFELPFVWAFPFHVGIHGLFVNQFLSGFEGGLDLVHVHTPLPPALSIVTPIVTTFHTPHFADSFATDPTSLRLSLTKILGILSRDLERSLISSSRVITAVSHGVASDLEAYYGVDRKRVLVVGNAPGDRFLKAGANSLERRNDMTILFAGRLEARKGVLDLLDCMRIVAINIPQARLVIIGKGPLASSITRKVAELELQKQVVIKGFVTSQELLDSMLRSSMFVLPSHYEGLPTVALEAMACRLPVVATTARGNSDLIRSGTTGLLVPPRSPATLAQAVVRLLQHPELREKLAKNARRMIEKNFTWDRVCDRVLAAYELAVTGKQYSCASISGQRTDNPGSTH